MKKIARILLIITITISLSGCFSNFPETKPDRSRISFAIQETREYIFQNGGEIEWGEFSLMGQNYKGITRTVSDRLFFSVAASEKTPASLIFDYYFTSGEASTQVYLSLSAESPEYEWKLCQTGGKGIEAKGELSPWDYRLSVENHKNTTEENAKELMTQALKFMLPNINRLLKDHDLPYTYLDFGFSDLEGSPFQSGASVPPSPLKITINDVRTNYSGVSEAYLQFTNTGDQAIALFSFYIRCYGTQGELIRGNNGQEFYTGTYDGRPLAPGQTTSSQLYWGIPGFGQTKRIEAAVYHYQPKDGKPVNIPEDQLHWVRME